MLFFLNFAPNDAKLERSFNLKFLRIKVDKKLILFDLFPRNPLFSDLRGTGLSPAVTGGHLEKQASKQSSDGTSETLNTANLLE